MLMQWFRFYHGTVSDPKIRLIAAKAEVPIHQVIAVWVAMLEKASSNDPRGTIKGWDDEVESVALEIEISAIERIRKQMTGRLLDEVTVLSWKRRQPKREDGSAERARAWREKKKSTVNSPELNRTHLNLDREDREERKKEDSPPNPPEESGGDSQSEMDWEDFKAAYPRRSGGQPWKPAKANFIREVTKHKVDAQTIIAGAKRYAEEMARTDKVGTEYVAQARTWLNQERWNDGYSDAPGDNLFGQDDEPNDETIQLMRIRNRAMADAGFTAAEMKAQQAWKMTNQEFGELLAKRRAEKDSGDR
jgi:hypothetical protein